ncbi:uncharacterized protein LOC132170010 [Corylus avellana]|uniref:uncharacterized protein LOC132170010 n=1 Tax=Corylus avellana TaxID=13451 RepID=UPI00286AF00C|nr:uncharacterized protein LOC132170010 [Corylus avellana]
MKTSCLIRESQNQVNIPEIHTIIGGFVRGGESGRARKAYARQLGNSHEVYTIGKPMKQSRRTEMVIGFSDADYVGISHPHTDALVVTITVANHNVHRILMDNGSSADILYWSAFKKLNLGQERIVPTSCPLMRLTGEQVQPVGSIELQVTAGSYPRQMTVMVRFLLVDRPSIYNAIIGRMTLNELRAITSTPHLKIRFPTNHGVGEIRGDQRAARQCYNISMKECPRTSTRGSTNSTVKEKLKSFLRDNCDVFTWSHEVMPGMAPSVMAHKLNADPSFKLVRQKRRVYSAEKSKVTAEEVEKLREAEFIKKI